jgi:hypothetical protein
VQYVRRYRVGTLGGKRIENNFLLTNSISVLQTTKERKKN